MATGGPGLGACLVVLASQAASTILPVSVDALVIIRAVATVTVSVDSRETLRCSPNIPVWETRLVSTRREWDCICPQPCTTGSPC